MMDKVQDDMLLDDSATKLRPGEDDEAMQLEGEKKALNKGLSNYFGGMMKKSRTKGSISQSGLSGTELQKQQTTPDKNVQFMGDENDGVLNLNLNN